MMKMWKVSKIDAILWIVTMLGVVVIDVGYGLILGVLVAISILIYRGQHPTMVRLAAVPETDVYIQHDLYDNVSGKYS